MRNGFFITALMTSIMISKIAHAAEEVAVFAGGCFWCVESDFEPIEGVIKAASGYVGGSAATASYKQISSGGTGHVEAVKITYDPSKINYEALLDIFWRTIDPVDNGGQFCDRGNSYKSAIFAQNKKQLAQAKRSKKNINSTGRLPKKVVTPIVIDTTFYPAEDYHQDYYKKSDIVLTRYGAISKKKAYKKYRKSCGRDARVIELWGQDAFILSGK